MTTTELQKKENMVELKHFLNESAVKSKFEEVLGKKAPQFLASILNVADQSEQLKLCSPVSIMSSAMVAASLDLPIDSNLGFSALVPYNSSKTGYQAQFQIMYKGFIQLAIRSGYYKDMNCSSIYADELISYNPIYGTIETVKDFSKCKDRASGDKSKIVGYFAWFEMNTGYRHELYMTTEEVEQHALEYSQSYKSDKRYNRKSSRWSTDFEKMALKTVMKMLLSKWGMLSVEMQNAMLSDQKIFDNDGNGMFSDNMQETEQDNNEVVDVFEADATEKKEEAEEPTEQIEIPFDSVEGNA